MSDIFEMVTFDECSLYNDAYYISGNDSTLWIFWQQRQFKGMEEQKTQLNQLCRWKISIMELHQEIK